MDAADLLRSRQTDDRLRAVRMLARSQDNDTERYALLLVALDDKVSYVATLAADALAGCDHLPTLARLTAKFLVLSEDGLKRDAGCHIRAKLALVFGKQEYAPAADALRIGIRTRQMEPVAGVPFDTGIHLRINCALALAQLRAPDALRDISLLLYDRGDRLGDPLPLLAVKQALMESRKGAAQALSRLADIGGRLPLTLRLTFPEDETPDVLQECMQALVELEDPQALAVLTPYLQHPDRNLAAYAALMIAQTRDPQAAALLHRALPHFTRDPLRAVVLALTSLRTDESEAILRALNTDPSPEVRRIVREVWSDSTLPNG